MTPGARIAWLAGTPVSSEPSPEYANTTTAVLAGLGNTEVDFAFTLGASVASRTGTSVRVQFILASSSVSTWVRCAVVDNCFTVAACVTGETYTVVFIDSIDTFAVLAWTWSAVIYYFLTVLASISRFAYT